MINKRYWQNGQMGLVVLLILVVMTTVGVSVATRSVSELRLSRQEQESTKALNAAEAGIEDALTKDLSSVGCPTGGTSCGPVTVDGIDVYYTVDPSTSLDNIPVSAGHTLDVNTAGASSITISWAGTGDECNNAAIVVAKISSTGVNREAFDGCDSRNDSNNFDDPNGTGNETTVSVSGFDTARIKALYASSDISVSVTAATPPVQSYIVKSSATLEDGTTRAVQVTQRVGSLPSIFDYALFSGDTIIK